MRIYLDHNATAPLLPAARDAMLPFLGPPANPSSAHREGARAREGEFRATSLCTLVQMVSSSGGITLIPTLAVDLEAKRAGLHVRPLAGSGARRTIALVWRKGTSIDGLLHAIAKVMRDRYPQVKRRGRQA